MSTPFQKPAPNHAKYDFWIKNNLNVLFCGHRGIGKTERVKEKFTEHFGKMGVKWLYFSGSTMDPWVDFVGVPKERIGPDGEPYLDLIRPKVMQNDEIEAIMIDEFNRGNDKMRNAVMELIQFKSINGKEYKNLKIVWAAINPHDDNETYDVEPLDPAQKDRFHVYIEMPYDVDVEYFTKKFGNEGIVACSWWRKQSDELKMEISPRRLDYAMEMFTMGGDLSDILPPQANIQELVTEITSGSYTQRLKTLFLLNNDEETRESFQNENFYFGTEKIILQNKEYIKYFVPFFPPEKLIKVFIESYDVRYNLTSEHDYRDFQHVFDPLLSHEAELSKHPKSIETSLNRWRDKFIRPDKLSDLNFLDLVSDKKRNMDMLRDPKNYTEIINRIFLILDKNTLPEDSYIKMLGVMCELLVRVDGKHEQAVINNIKLIKKAMDNQNYSRIEDVLSTNLPALRKASSSTIFVDVIDKLVKAKVIENHENY